MATHERVTITVPPWILAKARHAVEKRLADSVSDYFVTLAEKEPDWAAAQEVVAEMTAEAGGPSPEAEAWADELFGHSTTTEPSAS